MLLPRSPSPHLPPGPALSVTGLVLNRFSSGRRWCTLHSTEKPIGQLKCRDHAQHPIYSVGEGSQQTGSRSIGFKALQ